jgi:hypothetical protein
MKTRRGIQYRRFFEVNVVRKLIVLAFVFFVFWQSPESTELFSIFTILATYYHEMSHGIVALLVGMDFTHINIKSSGDGYAQIYYETKDAHADVKNAVVSLAGPLGAPVLGTILLVLSCHGHVAMKRSLAMLSLCMIFTCAIWVRGKDLGISFLYIIGLFLLYTAIKFPSWALRSTMRFFGIHACTSVFTEVDYLFSRTVAEFEERVGDLSMDEKMMKKFLKKKSSALTDTGEIQKLIGVSYQTVGFSVILISLVLMGMALYYVHYRESKRKAVKVPLPR